VYTTSRILLFVATTGVLWLLGMRGNGLLLLAVALLISGLLSFVLLSRQRDAMSAAVVETGERWNRWMSRRAASEDAADDAWRAEQEAGQLSEPKGPDTDREPGSGSGT
jgi:hypothetical protein